MEHSDDYEVQSVDKDFEEELSAAEDENVNATAAEGDEFADDGDENTTAEQDPATGPVDEANVSEQASEYDEDFTPDEPAEDQEVPATPSAEDGQQEVDGYALEEADEGEEGTATVMPEADAASNMPTPDEDVGAVPEAYAATSAPQTPAPILDEDGEAVPEAYAASNGPQTPALMPDEDAEAEPEAYIASSAPRTPTQMPDEDAEAVPAVGTDNLAAEAPSPVPESGTETPSGLPTENAEGAPEVDAAGTVAEAPYSASEDKSEVPAARAASSSAKIPSAIQQESAETFPLPKCNSTSNTSQPIPHSDPETLIPVETFMSELRKRPWYSSAGTTMQQRASYPPAISTGAEVNHQKSQLGRMQESPKRSAPAFSMGLRTGPGIFTQSFTPGPGAYKREDEAARSLPHLSRPFGTEQRFALHIRTDVPGPGMYAVDGVAKLSTKHPLPPVAFTTGGRKRIPTKGFEYEFYGQNSPGPIYKPRTPNAKNSAVFGLAARPVDPTVVTIHQRQLAEMPGPGGYYQDAAGPTPGTEKASKTTFGLSSRPAAAKTSLLPGQAASMLAGTASQGPATYDPSEDMLSKHRSFGPPSFGIGTRFPPLRSSGPGPGQYVA